MAKPENWTDYERPCLDNYNPEHCLTRDELIEEHDNVEDCDCFAATGCDVHTHCAWKEEGHGWFDCTSGRLSKHCDWLKKEGTDAAE